MDADKNGEVDREEVRKVMQIYISEIVGEKVDSNSMPVERSLESFMKRYDANSDGKITFEEWRDCLLKDAEKNSDENSVNSDRDD